jgi:hypothetical protein
LEDANHYFMKRSIWQRRIRRPGKIVDYFRRFINAAAHIVLLDELVGAWPGLGIAPARCRHCAVP